MEIKPQGELLSENERRQLFAQIASAEYWKGAQPPEEHAAFEKWAKKMRALVNRVTKNRTYYKP